MKTLNKVVIKVGTNVLTNDKGLLDQEVIKNLVTQIIDLKKNGVEIILVSSGAVGAGKSIINIDEEKSKVAKRQVFSAIGQIHLMNVYNEVFLEGGLHCAQILITKDDFRDRKHYRNMQRCFQALLRDEVIPIVNENDVVSITELMFTDNDELAGLIASMMNADALIILSNVDGLYKGENEEVIHEVEVDDNTIKKVIKPSKSKFGRGGMHTKVRVCKKLSSIGVTSFIANGNQNNVLLDIFEGKKVGTRFNPGPEISNIKKHIANAKGWEEGTVSINQGAEEALLSEDKVSSLLPIGITDIKGDFKKGDIVKILNERGETLGLGIAQYNAEKAKSNVGKKDKKALVHYNYLFIDNYI